MSGGDPCRLAQLALLVQAPPVEVALPADGGDPAVDACRLHVGPAPVVGAHGRLAGLPSPDMAFRIDQGCLRTVTVDGCDGRMVGCNQRFWLSLFIFEIADLTCCV